MILFYDKSYLNYEKKEKEQEQLMSRLISLFRMVIEFNTSIKILISIFYIKYQTSMQLNINKFKLS